MSRPKLHRAHSSAAVDPAPPSRLALCCLGPILNPERDNQYYELLGVDRRCSQTEIKKAYRKISLEMHPDKRRQRGIPVTQEDRERFIRAKEAYEVLSDPKRRKVYDALGELGVQLTENPTSVDQNKVMRTMSHMSETTRCSILLIALAFVGFFGLYFPVLLSTNVQHTTDIPWGWVFLPVWVIDAFVLLNHLAFVGEGCSGSEEGGAPSDPENPTDEDFDDDDAHGDDIPVSARIFHLVVFLLLVIFQILLVWMISTPSEDRDNWGGVFAPLFLSEALRLCVLIPGACTSIPPIDLGDTSDTSDEANFEREVQMMRAAQNRAIRSMHRRAIFGLLFRVLQEILIVVKLMGAQMSWYEVFIPIWVYCGSQLLGGCGYCALSNTIQATITPPPEGATDNSWMTPEDRVKAQAAQEASAAGTAACCSFVCVFVVAILVAVKAQDYSSFHAIIIFIPLLVCLCLCYCCTCLFICTFRELPEEEPGSSYEAPAAPPVVPASPTPSPIIPQAAPPAPAPVVVPPPAPSVTKEPEKMVSLD